MRVEGIFLSRGERVDKGLALFKHAGLVMEMCVVYKIGRGAWGLMSIGRWEAHEHGRVELAAVRDRQARGKERGENNVLLRRPEAP